MVGDDGSESSFASHRKKLSAFTIESILSGMADIKDEDSLSETNLNTSFEEGSMERDFARSPSPTTSTASSPPTSPHMSAVMAHHIRQYQVTGKDNLSLKWKQVLRNLNDIFLRHRSSNSRIRRREALEGWTMLPM